MCVYVTNFREVHMFYSELYLVTVANSIRKLANMC